LECSLPCYPLVPWHAIGGVRAVLFFMAALAGGNVLL
jgi:hypothetical protein